MSNLRPVPDTPPRAVLYLRQSISRDDSISLELQEVACREYCRQRGYQVIVVEADPGISGRTWKRPAVVRVMDLIESGGADVIVLWKWSRISRSRRDWALAADRVEVAGGRIESATEQVDVGTATGRLTRGMLVELAAFESDRIGEVWKEVHASRLARGLLPGGQARFGYRVNPDSGIHEPDPSTSVLLVSMYEQYASGLGFRTISMGLNADGHRTMRGRLWKGESVLDVLDSGFGAGLIRWGGTFHPGVHQAVIGDDLWQEYRDVRERKRRLPPRSKGSKYLLTGLLRCAACEGVMTAIPNRPGQQPAFRCKRRSEFGVGSKPGGCDGGSVTMGRAEGVVFDWLTEYGAQVDDEASRESVSLARQVSAEGEVKRVTREIGALDAQVDELTGHLGEGVVSVEAYGRAVEALSARRAVKVERLEEVGREVREAGKDRRAIARALVADWYKTPLEVRQATLRDLIDRVMVVTTSARNVPGVSGSVSLAELVVHAAD